MSRHHPRGTCDVERQHFIIYFCLISDRLHLMPGGPGQSARWNSFPGRPGSWGGGICPHHGPLQLLPKHPSLPTEPFTGGLRIQRPPNTHLTEPTCPSGSWLLHCRELGLQVAVGAFHTCLLAMSSLDTSPSPSPPHHTCLSTEQVPTYHPLPVTPVCPQSGCPHTILWMLGMQGLIWAVDDSCPSHTHLAWAPARAVSSAAVGCGGVDTVPARGHRSAGLERRHPGHR